MELKDRLYTLRTDRDITQEQFADALNTTKQAVSHWERGSRYPKKEMLEAIADFFNVDMDYLVGRSSSTTKAVSEEELRVLTAYRAASEETKTNICKILDIRRYVL